MKTTIRYSLPVLAALMLLLAGCYKSDYNGCVSKTNATIYFSLKDEANNEVFPATVDNVELFVYNAAGMQISRNIITQSELSLFAGTRLKLEPGTYTVVAWANATAARTRSFTNENMHWLDRTNNYLLNAIAVGGMVEDGDPLYYAPKTKGTPLTLTVPVEGSAEAVAEFRNAHIKVEVTVEGYEHISPRAVADPLKIELTGITSRYDFAMATHGDRVSYVRYAPNIDVANKIFNTSFNVPVFDRNTITQIRITNNTGRLVIPAISLKEILNDRVEVEKMTYLPVRIKFTEENGLIQVAVTIDIPEWGENIIKPSM